MTGAGLDRATRWVRRAAALAGVAAATFAVAEVLATYAVITGLSQSTDPNKMALLLVPTVGLVLFGTATSAAILAFRASTALARGQPEIALEALGRSGRLLFWPSSLLAAGLGVIALAFFVLWITGAGADLSDLFLFGAVEALAGLAIFVPSAGSVWAGRRGRRLLLNAGATPVP